MKRILIVASLLVLLVCIDGARPRGRGRARGRRRGNCHMKAIDKCLNKAESTSNDPNSSSLITTEEGVQQICETSQSVVKCIKGYIKKCGTPLQRELFDFMIEQFSRSVDNFCNSSETKQNFLKHSPCIHAKVLQTDEYKTECTMPFLASLDATKKADNPDDRLDLTCCSYNRWEDCAYGKIEKACTKDARNAMVDFLQGAFAGQTKTICNDASFDFKAEMCTKHYPPPGTKAKGKLSDNPLTKYIANYFGFLFN